MGEMFMIITLEISAPALWKPGIFRSTLGGKPYRRMWFAWFAISWWPGDGRDYSEACRNGEWINTDFATRDKTC